MNRPRPTAGTAPRLAALLLAGGLALPAAAADPAPLPTGRPIEVDLGGKSWDEFFKAAAVTQPDKLPDLPPVPAVPVPAAPAPLPPAKPAPPPDPVTVGGVPMTADALGLLLDAGAPPVQRHAGCEACGGGSRQCVPGRKDCCEPFPARTAVGRFVGCLYDIIVCPDPCYQPRWEPLANAGLFVGGARPVGQAGFRWTYLPQIKYPDRAEWFWPRADGRGKGPSPVAPYLGERRVDTHELNQFVEIAAGGFSTTIETRYLSLNPDLAPHAAGFGDLIIGTKSLLFDSELLLLAFQFRTYIPTGNFRKGLGTGHVSLEPGLIAGLRLTCDTYLQAQVNEWVPLGGDQDYMGALLRYEFSVNHVLWRPVKDVQLIGTAEWGGLSFQDGAYTDPVLGPYQKASGTTAFHAGVGGRLFFADKLDFGVGYQAGVGGAYFAKSQFRMEFRVRY